MMISYVEISTASPSIVETEKAYVPVAFLPKACLAADMKSSPLERTPVKFGSLREINLHAELVLKSTYLGRE